jgi:hypothetical protein
MKPVPAATITQKKTLLRGRLETYGRLLVAFSGGKDSFFLWRQANETLGAANVLPYFVHTPFTLAAARESFPCPLRRSALIFSKTRACAGTPGSAAFIAK